MARIRSIKPELPTDRRLATCSIEARYTFVLLISQADDYGLIPAEPRQLLGQLYPHDSTIAESQLLAWIRELANCGRVRWRETVDGAKVLEIVNWNKHQVVKNPGKPLLRDKLHPSDGRMSVESSAILPQPSVGLGGAEREGEREGDLGKGPRSFSAQNGAEQPGGEVPAWSHRAVVLATARALPYQPGRYLRVLKPFVVRDGADVALGHWQVFLESGRHFDERGEYLDPQGPTTLLRPERFRDSYDEWKPSTRGTS